MNEGLHKLRIRLPAIVLLIATVLFWGRYDRYEPAGPPLLSNPGLADADRVRGDCVESNGVFILRVDEGGPTAGLSFRLPEFTRYEYIRVRGRIRTENVVTGKYSWRCARLLMTQYRNDKWLPGDHGVVALSGTVDWEHREDVFTVMPEAEYGMLQVQQVGRSGTARFADLEVEPVRLKSSYAWLRMLFAVLWFSMVPLYFKRCRLNRRKLRILILLNAVAILSGTIMPGDWIEDITDYAKKIESKAVSKSSAGTAQGKSADGNESVHSGFEQFHDVVENVHGAGHFLLFASLCFLVYLSAELERQHPIYFIKVIFDIVLFAGVTESLQYLTFDRIPGFHDWLFDVYGMLCAFLLFALIYPLVRILGKRGDEPEVA